MSRQCILIPWAMATILFLILAMKHSHNYADQYMIWRGGPCIVLGVESIACNLFFILRTSELIREKLPLAISLLPHAADRAKSMASLANKIFVPWLLIVYGIATLLLAKLTFMRLGIFLNAAFGKTVFWFFTIISFWTMSTTVGLAVGFWRWMNEFGKLRPKVDVFHTDQVGGLGPVADVSDWVISMGSVIAAVYSLCACFGPYARTDQKGYAYLWIVLATFLMILAFLIPAHSIHLCLKDAKFEAANKLSKHSAKVFKQFELGTLDNSAEVAALKWFSESLDHLNVWPYRQLAARVIVSGSVPLSAIAKLVWHHFHGNG